MSRSPRRRHLLLGGGRGVAGLGEDDVAAHLGPFVVMLGQDGADEAVQGDLPCVSRTRTLKHSCS